VKQKDMAVALGLTKGTISKFVAKGMPLDSVEAAQSWRATHNSEGSGHKSTSASVTAAARSLTLKPQRPGGAFASAPDDPAGTLARMRETEQRVYVLIDAALKKADTSKRDDDYAAIPGLIRSYNQAGANSLAAASAWERHCRASGQVAPVEHLVNVLTSRLEPLAAQLRSFAATVAPKANPASPSTAEAAIAADLEAILRQIGAALAPIPPAPDTPIASAAP
jgi:hypothetical protein